MNCVSSNGSTPPVSRSVAVGKRRDDEGRYCEKTQTETGDAAACIHGDLTPALQKLWIDLGSATYNATSLGVLVPT